MAAKRAWNLFLDIFKDFTKDEMETLWGFLKRMYSFDGAEQDGFEEEAGFGPGEEQDRAQARLLMEFKKRRGEYKIGKILLAIALFAVYSCSGSRSANLPMKKGNFQIRDKK